MGPGGKKANVNPDVRITRVSHCSECKAFYPNATIWRCPKDNTVLLTKVSVDRMEQNTWWEMAKCFGNSFCPKCRTLFDEVREKCPVDKTKPLETFKQRPGPTLQDKHQLQDYVGFYDFMEVYKATDEHDEEVHVKLLMWNDQYTVGNVIKRTQPAIGIKHQNLMTIVAVEITTIGFPYIVTDRVSAIPLRQRIGDTFVEEKVAIKLFADILEALQFLHDNGIVHGAITTSNLFVERISESTEVGILAHIGLAERLFQKIEWHGVSTETHTTNLYTDPNGMCPEFCKGTRPTPATDIYQIGCALYQTLCGQPVFTRPAWTAVLFAHGSDAPDDILQHNPKVSSEIKYLVEKSLEKDPANRFESAVEFRTRLLALL